MAYKPDDPYWAAENIMVVLQDLLNRTNLAAAGEVIDKSRRNGISFGEGVLLEDVYEQMPVEEDRDPRYAKVRDLVDDVCGDWANKAKICMGSLPRDKMNMYLNRVESLSSDLIIKRGLNRDSGYGQAYMGKTIKKVVSDLREFAPAYDSGLTHV